MWSYSLGLGRGANNSAPKTGLFTKSDWAWSDPFEQNKKLKKKKRFYTWNVGSLNMSDSLRTVASEIALYKLDVVGVEEVRWDTGGNHRPVGYYCFY